MKIAIALMLVLSIVALCSCGVSGGKKVGIRAVIDILENYQDIDSERALHTIGIAKTSGDPAREADARASLHLDACEQILVADQRWRELQKRSRDLESRLYIQQHGDLPPEAEQEKRIKSDMEKNDTRTKDRLKGCLETLRNDLKTIR